MLPYSKPVTTEQRKLLALFDRLGPDDRRSLLAFARFLSEQGDKPEKQSPPPEPALVPGGEGETVVAALKRLSKSYYMVDKSRVLDATAALMAEHVVQGRSASEVIEEFERLFAEHYRELVASHADPD